MIAIDPPSLGGSNSFHDILNNLKEAKRKKYAMLYDLPYDFFMMKTTKSISKICQSNQIIDSFNYSKIATKVYIYMKLRKDFFLDFFSMLENLVSTDLTTVIVCTYVQSKFLKIVPRGFVKKFFFGFVHNQEKSPINLAYFAYFMIKESSNSVIFCIKEFIDLISQIIINHEQKVRLIAFDTLNITLKLLRSTSNVNLESITINLFYKAKEKLSGDFIHEKQGSFLILSSVFQNIPEQIIDQSLELIDFFISNLNSTDFHLYSMYNILLLAQYDKDSFLQNYYTKLFNILKDDNCSSQVSYLCSHCMLLFYSAFSQQTISNEENLIDILENLTKHRESIKHAYQVISHISINYPFFIQKNEQFFILLFRRSISFINEISHQFVDLIYSFPCKIDYKIFSQEIFTEFQKNQSKEFLEFLSNCPPLDNDQIQNVLISMLSNPDPGIRSQISSAILQQMSYDDKDFVCTIFHQIFSLALSDPNPAIRASIVSSFRSQCYKYLTLPIHLESLTKLLHDESTEVRNCTIDLLGNISQYNPFDVFVILREILLEHLFAIDVKSMKSFKSRISHSLCHIFTACKEIMPLYYPTFCDIALRELSNLPIGKLTYFEQKFSDQISKNIMKAICFIAKTDISQLKSHLKQFVNFFIWQLQQEVTKEIKLSIIETLYVILTRAGPIDDIDMDKLNLSLMSFAAKWNSTKMNLAILKLVGFIGVSNQQSEAEIEKNEEIKNNDNNDSSNDSSYFLSCACTTLLSILNNSTLVSYHISCLKALASIFSNDFEMYGQKYFSKFITIVINQIRLTNSKEYIDILNQICCGSPFSWVLKYKSDIFNLTQEILEKKENSEVILDFIPTLCIAFKSKAGIIYQNGIAYIYDILEKNMKKEEGADVSIKSLNAIISMRFITDNFIFLNVPKFLFILEKERVITPVKFKIVDSIAFLLQQRNVDILSFSPNILRTLLDVLVKVDEKNDQEFIEKIVQAIFCLIVKSGSNFSYFKSRTTSLIDSLKNLPASEKSNYHAIIDRSPPYSFRDFSFIHDQSPDDFQNSSLILSSKTDKNNKSCSETNINKNSRINNNKEDESNSNNNNNSINENNNNNNENEANNNDDDEKISHNNKEDESNSNKNNNDDNQSNSNNNNNSINENNNNNDENIENNNNDDDERSNSNNNSDDDLISSAISSNAWSIDEEIIRNAISMQEEETSWSWKDWYNNLVSTFISNSPSPFISPCSFLCKDLFSSAENIFCPAFLTVWIFLSTDTQLFVSNSLTRAINSDALPKYVCSSIISLIEYLERNECSMMIPKQVVCKACQKCAQYRNAFYFAYKWLIDEPNSIEANETMIRISAYFGQTKMKKGLAKVAQKRIDTSTSPGWFELIDEWSAARQIYENQGYVDNFPKIMKCLTQEHRWEEIVDKIDMFESIENLELKQTSAKFILSALYHCHKWEKINEILPFCPKNSVNVLTILALFQNSQGKKKEALESIENAFNILASNTRGIIMQDRTLLDKLIIKSQQLHEVLEIISDDNPIFGEKIEKIRENRIKKCPKTFKFYNQILSISLNMRPIDYNLKYVIRMLKCALREERFNQFNASLHYLFPDSSKWPASVAFLHCKSIWKMGKNKEAIEKIDSILKNSSFTQQIEANPKLKCKMYYTYADWIYRSASLTSIFHVLKQVVDLLEISMRTKIRFYKSFHRWAWGCSLMFIKAPNVKQHAVSAIHGFLESIKLKKEAPFDDLVKMISLFFRTKLDEKSFDEISQRIGMLSDSNFLLIIPQIFAQIVSDEKAPQSLFAAKILTRLMPIHYHAFLMNLLFDREPNQIINNLINWFVKKDATAFSEGLAIKKGLVLCSSSSMEYWMFDITKAIAAIQKKKLRLAVETLGDTVSRQPQPGESEKEDEFRNKIRQVLESILSNFKRSPHTSTTAVPVAVSSQSVSFEAMKKSKSNPDIRNINVLSNLTSKANPPPDPNDKNFVIFEAVQQLKKIHSLIREHLSNIQYLSMFNVAPGLFLLRNSVIAVPGTYEPNQPKILIKQFDPTLEIYNSKQRPRFLVIYGDDGSRHKSLLKGREDLRLDNRLMQFFLLINQHINHNYRPSTDRNQQQAKISRYAITPITKNCGLIQYVNGADTMFSLITEYRNNHSMNIFAEQTIENNFATPNVDSLRPIQRVEALREAISQTNDDDLRKIMWFKSPSLKDLMLRTIMFAQSNAVMSIICYILGIGDRHPSNLLIQRYTGKVIHIDFGDCFEAARRRKIFPEMIPFRLTRMMIKAFGPNEIEGDFRITCEQTLKLVRKHVYSLMGILDIFMQEPLEDHLSSDPKKSVYISKKEKSSTKNSPNSKSGKNEFDPSSHSKQTNDFNDFYEEEENGEIEEENAPDIKECIKRVSEKIIGKDIDLSLDNDNFLSVENQVTFLIGNATNEYNYAYLYHGWTPLW